MITKSKDELISRLTRAGLIFSQFQLVNEGDYEVYDADWNYKDVPHLNALHRLVNCFPTSIEEQVITTINFQEVLGLTIPLVVVNYHSGTDRQTYYTSFLGLLLIIETTWESIGEIRTRVTTSYAIGSKWFLRWAHPIVKRLISRNYAVLMSEDIPMRTRRGQLRRWGYGFRTDGRPHTFTSTLHILDENMVMKQELHPPASVRLSFAELAAIKEKDLLTTESDHWGLRFSVRENHLNIYPRLCPHEGACLDVEPITKEAVRCPWHGRMLRPLASLPLPLAAEIAPIDLRYHRLVFSADGLEIQFKDTPMASHVDPHELAPTLDLF
jgi:hypothetical protein